MKDWVGNYHSVVTCLGAQNEAQQPREENDYYATEPKAAELLLQIEDFQDDIWECACGAGHLAKVFEANGYNVRSTDLIDRGYGQGGVDFLKETAKWHGDIVTNPPYKFATEFIYHALELLEEGSKLVMFLKVQFLEGKERRKLYMKYPPARVWVSSSRLKCGRGGHLAVVR